MLNPVNQWRKRDGTKPIMLILPVWGDQAILPLVTALHTLPPRIYMNVVCQPLRRPDESAATSMITRRSRGCFRRAVIRTGRRTILRSEGRQRGRRRGGDRWGSRRESGARGLNKRGHNRWHTRAKRTLLVRDQRVRLKQNGVQTSGLKPVNGNRVLTAPNREEERFVPRLQHPKGACIRRLQRCSMSVATNKHELCSAKLGGHMG